MQICIGNENSRTHVLKSSLVLFSENYKMESSTTGDVILTKCENFLKPFVDEDSHPIFGNLLKNIFYPPKSLPVPQKSVIEVVRTPSEIKGFSTKDKYYLDTTLQSFVEAGHVKGVNFPIPEGILPMGFSGSLEDYKPKTRKADEEMYNKHKDLRRDFPRGISVLRLKSETQESAHVVIFALKKFPGYNFGDEDDITEFELPPSEYFLQLPDQATNIVSAEKVNGEAAHFSGRFIGDEFYLIGGSKNVHMIFQNKEHIQKYEGDRYNIARHIALVILEHWNSLDQQRKECLASFLHLTRVTFVGEVKMHDHQHIVYFEGLNKHELVFFSMTPPPSEIGKYIASFTALPTKYALEILQQFNFNVIEYSSIKPEKIEGHNQSARKLINGEGVVLYYEDDKENTIGLLKLKSMWYIHLRALRQQASYRFKISEKNKLARKAPIEEAKRRAKKRLDEIQVWLRTPEVELEAWKRMSEEWFNWLEVNMKPDNSDGYEARELRDNFSTIWKPFIVDHCSIKPEFQSDLKLLRLLETYSKT